MKMITELFELYFVKLQFMVIIKIVHVVFFYQYSMSFIYSVYCTSLSITISFFIYIYMSFFSFLSQHLFLFFLLCFFYLFIYFFIFCLISTFYCLFDNSQLSLFRSISFMSITRFMFIVLLLLSSQLLLLSMVFLFYSLVYQLLFFLLVYSFCKQLGYYLQPAEMLLTISPTTPKLNQIAFLTMNPLLHIGGTHFKQCL